MRHTLPLVTIVLALSALAGCSRSEASTQPPPSNSAAGQGATTPNGQLRHLVFFMNPNGQPCQIQQGILNDMASELNGKVQIVRYRTTSPKDIAMFEQYGIRSLPALVLTDSLGNELRRASPGIQDTTEVRKLIAP